MHTHTRRLLAALGGAAATSLAALALSIGPASADPAGTSGRGVTSQQASENDNDGQSSEVDLGAARNGGTDRYLTPTAPPEGVDVRRLLNSIDDPRSKTPPAAPKTTAPATTAAVDTGSSVEYLQIALGAVAGATVLGLGLAASHRWGHHHAPRPV